MKRILLLVPILSLTFSLSAQEYRDTKHPKNNRVFAEDDARSKEIIDEHYLIVNLIQTEVSNQAEEHFQYGFFLTVRDRTKTGEKIKYVSITFTDTDHTIIQEGRNLYIHYPHHLYEIVRHNIYESGLCSVQYFHTKNENGDLVPHAYVIGYGDD